MFLKMAELKGIKRRLSINLSFLNPNDQTPPINNNSSKKFEGANGVVGLGIVAALDQTHNPNFSGKSSRAVILGVSPRSTPIPISGNCLGSNFEEMELSEDYTCVISHIGNNLIKKKEYFDGNLTTKSETTVAAALTNYWVNSGVFSASSPPPAGESAAKAVFGTADFLSCCYLCKKKLHGLDIFMNRGENAFCSAECRDKHITADEHKEKCRSRVKKPQQYSVLGFTLLWANAVFCRGGCGIETIIITKE